MNDILALLIIVLTVSGMCFVASIPFFIIGKISGTKPGWQRSSINRMITRSYSQSKANQANLENAMVTAQWRYENLWKRKEGGDK